MIQSKIIEIEGESRIVLKFQYSAALHEEVKKISGRKWNQRDQFWHIPNTRLNRLRFGLPLYFSSPEKGEKNDKLEHFVAWMRSKRYSKNTIKSYSEAIVVFLNFFSNKSPKDIVKEDVILFNNEYILKRKLSSTYQNQFVSSIKLFFNVIENKKIEAQLIHRPRIARPLPNVLSKEEVKAILSAPINLKHRMMLTLIYACGLRSGELISLKPSDILSDRNLLHIKQAKGKKDRIVSISDNLIDLLRAYYKLYRPKTWLFEGQFIGKPYSARSLQ